MSSGELLQTIQLFALMFVALVFVYQLIRSFSYLNPVAANVSSHAVGRITLSYTSCLTVINYDCFHKLQIWRYFRFSS